MVGETPPFFSFEDAYLQVADIWDRAGYLERLTLHHTSGKLPVTGWPNGTGERRGIPPGDYRFAFGTDGRGAMAICKNLAAKWLRGPMPWQLLAGANPSSDWRTPPPRSPPARRLLAEGATEIDRRAYRAIMRECRRAKPGDAPLVFTDLQLGAKEFVKLFRKRPAKAAGRRPISEHDMRKTLQLAAAKNEPGKVFGVRDAQTLLNKTERPYDRDLMRTIVNELSSGRGPGRPRKVK